MLSKNLWNWILTVLYFVCTINIIFQNCLRTRRVKKRRKVQTDDGVRNLSKRIQITSIVCRHAIRCLSQNVAWHIDSVFNLLTILFQMWLLSEIIRSRVYNILASLQCSFLFVRFYVFLWRFETPLKLFFLAVRRWMGRILWLHLSWRWSQHA